MKNKFNNHIITWYTQYGRKNLPWQSNNAYYVWVSEIMLQQTQVIKVIDYFNLFTKKFPTLDALATASSEDVLSSWSGLGYYNRARNLHKTAQICQQEHAGKLPKDMNQLVALPGIGRTTAGAILSLASDLPFPILDGNVKRVMSRAFAIKNEKISQLNKELWQLVERLMPQQRCREYNQALMDLGSLVCTRTNPHCEKCPVSSMCIAKKNNQIELYPQANKKTKQIKKTYHLLMIVNEKQILLEQRGSQGIWPELWFLPVYNNAKEIETVQIFDADKKSKSFEFNIQHILTHRKLDLQVHCYQNQTIIDQYLTKNYKWVDLSNFQKLPHPTALKKIIQYFLAHEDC
ncbi:MAG: A/G-specific adenine glycosylase [Marinicellaceae bacterium]